MCEISLQQQQQKMQTLEDTSEISTRPAVICCKRQIMPNQNPIYSYYRA